jgi:hypothetical protein
MTGRRMYRILVAAVAGVLGLAAALGPFAASAAPPGTVATTFEVRVSGHLAPMTTFWVAYGPLNGHFGIIRLYPAADGSFRATRSLPAQGKTVFSYLVGRGVVHSRLGEVPGNPVVTIRSIGPVEASQLRPRVVRWVTPAG